MKQFWSIALTVLSLCVANGCAGKTPVTAPPEVHGSGNIVIVSSPEQFDQAVASGFVLVDFWATWCPPCRFMNPILAEVAGEQADRLTLVKVDVDQNRALSERYKIESIPTFMLFKDGKAVDTKIGAFPKDQLLRWLDTHRG